MFDDNLIHMRAASLVFAIINCSMLSMNNDWRDNEDDYAVGGEASTWDHNE